MADDPRRRLSLPWGGLPKPFLAPPQPTLDYLSSGAVRPVQAAVRPVSTVHFLVHPEMDEVRALARARGWLDAGYTRLSITWVELRYTTDDWATARVLHSTDVPSPVVDGYFFLPDVAAGEEVSFAVHAGVACHAPEDVAGTRAEGDVWFNAGGANYRQRSR